MVIDDGVLAGGCNCGYCRSMALGWKCGWSLSENCRPGTNPEVLVWLRGRQGSGGWIVLCTVRRGGKDKGAEKLRKEMGPKQIVLHTQGCRECTDLSPTSACSATEVVVQ